MANLIGQRLGNYEIIGFLGEGGMASVYRAHQLTVKRDVAIKVIKAGLGDTTQFMQRFAREAETVAALNHPHILKVFDYGQQNDLAYLVMELQPGGSLAALIEAGQIPTARIATILDQVASALDYAHRQGIVHRDLKPQNVLLDPNGNAILTDFGIAKLLNDTSAALTQSGVAVGTPPYMAPEQWQGLAVDDRTDIYALGVMLFQMVSGHVPFSGDTPFSVMHKHIYDTPPSLVSDRPQLPIAVDAVIRTAMAKDPSARFQTAEAMAQSFRAALVGQTSPTGNISTAVPSSQTNLPRTDTATLPPKPPTPTGIMPENARRPAGQPNNLPLILAFGAVIVIGLAVGVGLALLSNRSAATPVPTAVAVIATPVPPTVTATITPTNTIAVSPTPTLTLTIDLSQTQIVQQIGQTQIALQTNAAALANGQAQLTAAANQVINRAATAIQVINQAATINALTKAAPTPVPTLAPTTAIPTATPTATTLPTNGNVSFANLAKGAYLDSLTLNLTHVPLPGEGQQYVAWLTDRAHPPLRLGKVTVRADGSGQLTYADPNGVNLLATYGVAFITRQSGAAASAQDPVVFSGAIPPLANVHVQHVLTHFPDTPGTIGLMLGALEQASILSEHANLLGQAITQGNVQLAKLHLEHLYNILTGTDGAKDLNGDGTLTVSPPGDGYGLLNYLTNAVEHANLASEQPDATPQMKLTAKRIGTAIANSSSAYLQLQALVVQAASKKTIADMKPLVAQIQALNNTAMNGATAGTATPDPDSAQFDGLQNAYNQALTLGTIALYPGDAAINGPAMSSAAGTAAATMAPMVMANLTPSPVSTATSIPANTVVIVLQDETFVPAQVTVKAGTVIIFSNQSPMQHTATADNGAFATGIIQPGTEAKAITLTKPGTYTFYCEFHGGPGQVGMSGVITVQ